MQATQLKFQFIIHMRVISPKEVKHGVFVNKNCILEVKINSRIGAVLEKKNYKTILTKHFNHFVLTKGKSCWSTKTLVNKSATSYYSTTHFTNLRHKVKLCSTVAAS